MITIDHRRMNTPITPPQNKKSVNNVSKTLKILCILTTTALLLTACDSPAGGTTSNNNTGNKDQPKPKFAVTYAGEIDWRIAGLGSFRPIGVSSESSNGSTLAKAYTITVGPRVGTSNSRYLSFRPTFKPTEAKDGATFAIQAIDPPPVPIWLVPRMSSIRSSRLQTSSFKPLMLQLVGREEVTFTVIQLLVQVDYLMILHMQQFPHRGTWRTRSRSPRRPTAPMTALRSKCSSRSPFGLSRKRGAGGPRHRMRLYERIVSHPVRVV